MNKKYFFFLIFFSFLCLPAQEKDTDDDGILDKDDFCPTIKGVQDFQGCPNPKKDCTEFQKERKFYYETLVGQAKDVDYSQLKMLIFNKLDFKKFKKKNILVSPKDIKGLICGVSSMNQCFSDYNDVDPNFSAIDFLSQEILLKLKKELKANIVPALSVNNFNTEWGIEFFEKNKVASFISEEYFVDVDKKFQVGKIIDNNGITQEIYYVKYDENKLNVEDANYLVFDFKNEIGNIVAIKIYYNKEEIPQRLKFKYEKNKWILL
jgi:hypothetical protein